MSKSKVTIGSVTIEYVEAGFVSITQETPPFQKVFTSEKALEKFFSDELHNHVSSKYREMIHPEKFV